MTFYEISKDYSYKFKNYFLFNPIKLEGPDIIVWVDKTKTNFKIKNHGGKSVSPCQVFCIIVTTTRPALGFCCIV